MKGYGQFCPVAKATEILGERWTLLVVRELLCGSRHFNDLRRGVPLMSPTLLSLRLKQLKRAGIVEHEPDRRNKQGVAYHLTAAGHELMPLVMMLGNWGQRWARSELRRDDLDPGLLMWDMHRRLNTDNLPAQRTVLQFEFRDVPTRKRFWWLVIKRDEVDVCLKRPGYDVDVTITTRLKTLAAVWIGDISLRDAVKQGLIDAQGPSQLTRQLDSWLALSPFAKIIPATAPPHVSGPRDKAH
jgi:DNA-binding HxlR family transcriptional regulator